MVLSRSTLCAYYNGIRINQPFRFVIFFYLIMKHLCNGLPSITLIYGLFTLVRSYFASPAAFIFYIGHNRCEDHIEMLWMYGRTYFISNMIIWLKTAVYCLHISLYARICICCMSLACFASLCFALLCPAVPYKRYAGSKYYTLFRN